MPKRIRMSRQHPWRADNPDAVIVARPSRWGNPFAVGEEVTINGWGEIATVTMTPALAVACYRDLMTTRLHRDPNDMPEDAAWVESWYTGLDEIRGHDLACWCSLDQPCHADILLELANS